MPFRPSGSLVTVFITTSPPPNILLRSLLGLSLLFAVSCARENPLTPPEAASGVELASPPDHAQNPGIPPGWNKRPDREGDRVWGTGGGEPPPDLHSGRVDTRYAVIEIKPTVPLNDVLTEAKATLVADLASIGMAQVRPTDWSQPPEVFLKKLSRTTGVLSAEFDLRVLASEARGMTVSFNDGSIRRADVEAQPFLGRIRAPEARALATGAGVRVAVLDTGVDPLHPDLAGRVVAGWDHVGRDAAPWDAATAIDEDEDGLVDEAFGHGTHVTGILAELAPGAEILVYRVLDDEGWGSASAVAQAVIRAVEDGADVINLSLGLYEDFKALDKAIDLAVKNRVVVVAAAGNDGVEDPAQYPALYPSVLAVGSADPGDALAWFSNFGRHLDVTAPGVDVLSLFPGGGYAAWSGSSMSSAIVSSLAALVVERHPDFTPAMVSRKITGGVAPGTGLLGWSGSGRVDFVSTLD